MAENMALSHMATGTYVSQATPDSASSGGIRCPDVINSWDQPPPAQLCRALSLFRHFLHATTPIFVISALFFCSISKDKIRAELVLSQPGSQILPVVVR